MHCGIFVWCIVGFVRWVYWYLPGTFTAMRWRWWWCILSARWCAGWWWWSWWGSWRIFRFTLIRRCGWKAAIMGCIWNSLDDVIKWKYFTRHWPFVMGIHRSPVNSLHKGQWRRVLMFSLICAWVNGLLNNHEAGDLRRHRADCDVTVMTRNLPARVLDY